MKHTPGPWRISGLSAHVVVDSNSVVVADMRREGDHPATDALCAANARLIAAAPELLEAAETILSALVVESEGLEDFDAEEEFPNSLMKLRAAIAKARA